jgi:putative transposase
LRRQRKAAPCFSSTREEYLGAMKLVATIKLTPTPKEADVLRRTLERVNEARNWLAARVFESRTVRLFDLHKLCYRDLRKRFELTAQVAIRCIAEACKAGTKDAQRRFNRHSFNRHSFNRHSFNRHSFNRHSFNRHLRRANCQLQGQRRHVDLAPRRTPQDQVCDGQAPARSARPPQARTRPDADPRSLVPSTWRPIVMAGSTRARRSRRYASACRGAAPDCNVAAPRPPNANFASSLENNGGSRVTKTTASPRRSCWRRNAPVAPSALKTSRAFANGSRPAVPNALGLVIGRSGRCRHSSPARRDVPASLCCSSPPNTPACGAIDDKNRANQATFSCISCRHAGHADVIAARNIRCRAEAALVTRP